MKKTKITSSAKMDDKFYVQSIHRALTIINEISKNNARGLSLSELSEKIVLPVSTVYRIIQNLVAWDYVREKENGNYVLGFALLYLGNTVEDTLNIRSYANKYLEQLNMDTKETIYLCVLDTNTQRVIYVDKKEGKHNIKLSSTIGGRNYVHSTANGKCLVSAWGNDKIEELLTKSGMPKLMKNTITTIPDYLDEIKKVRQEGYAIDAEENEPGVTCVAAPIFDYAENVVASISISGTLATVTAEDKPRYIAAVKEAALKISQELGYQYNND